MNTVEFKKFLFTLFQKCNLKNMYINILLDKNFDEYINIFKHTNDYIKYISLGNVTIRKCFTYYIFNNYKEDFINLNELLKSNEIFLTSLNIFVDYSTNKNIFEIFIGFTEELLDKLTEIGVGYGLLFNLLTCVYNKFYISNIKNIYHSIEPKQPKIDKQKLKDHIYKITKVDKNMQNIISTIILSSENIIIKINEIYNIVKKTKQNYYIDDKLFITKNIGKYLNNTTRYLINKNDTTIVDIGCGNGNLLSNFNIVYGLRKENLFCIETESDWTEKYNPINIDKINYIYWDNIYIPKIYNETIDIFIISVTLHHMKDEIIDNLFKNIKKLAKKESLIIIKEHDCRNDDDKFIIDWEHHLYYIVDSIKNNELLNVENYLNKYIDNYKSEKQYDEIFCKYGYIEKDRFGRIFEDKNKNDDKNLTKMYWKIYKRVK